MVLFLLCFFVLFFYSTVFAYFLFSENEKKSNVGEVQYNKSLQISRRSL